MLNMLHMCKYVYYAQVSVHVNVHVCGCVHVFVLVRTGQYCDFSAQYIV